MSVGTATSVRLSRSPPTFDISLLIYAFSFRRKNLLIWRTSKKGSFAVCLSARYQGSAFFIVIANVTVCRGCDLSTAFLPFLLLPLSLPSALVGKMLLSGKIMVSGSADGRKDEGIENEAERERNGNGISGGRRTNERLPTRSSSLCLPERDSSPCSVSDGGGGSV